MATILDNSSILIYRVGPVFCCAPCISVLSITHPAPLTKLPGQKSRHSGIFKFNTNLVNVCELRTNFGVAPEMWLNPGRVIITNLTSGYIGFWVDEIIDVMESPSEGWGNPPPLIPRAIFTKTLRLNNEIHLYADFENLNTIKQIGYLKSYIAHLEKIKSATLKVTSKTKSNKTVKINNKKDSLSGTSPDKPNNKKTNKITPSNITNNNIQSTPNTSTKKTHEDITANTEINKPEKTNDKKPSLPRTISKKSNIEKINKIIPKSITENNKSTKNKKTNLAVTSHDKSYVKKTNKVIADTTTKTNNKIKSKLSNKNTKNKISKPNHYQSHPTTENKINTNIKKTKDIPSPPNFSSNNVSTTQSFGGLLLSLILLIPILIVGYYLISSQQQTTLAKLTITEQVKNTAFNEVSTVAQTITADTSLSDISSSITMTEATKTSEPNITKPVTTNTNHLDISSGKTTIPEASQSLESSTTDVSSNIATTLSESTQSSEPVITDNNSATTTTDEAQASDPKQTNTTKIESEAKEKLTGVKKALIKSNKKFNTIAEQYPSNIELGINNNEGPKKIVSKIVPVVKNKHTADVINDSKGITIKLYTPINSKPKTLNPAKMATNNTKTNSIKNQNKVIKIPKKIINKKQIKLAPSIISKEIIHIVVKGDTLWHIAKFYVDNPYRYPELARLSNIKNPDLIYPGDRVHIIQIFTK